MRKTCNLSTVKNTPNEVRRNTSSVDYYYLDFCDDNIECGEITGESLSRVMNVIYDYLDERDIFCIPVMFVCARMLDGSVKRIFKIIIDDVDRHMRISRVK